jgi:ribosomal protein S12 methylthiotransferase accessory factor YcaO
LIWLTRPEGEPWHFQKSSNGQALGASLSDALVQGLYECVERDQYTLRRCSLNAFGVWPPRASFDHPVVRAIERAGLELFLFYCTFDISIPVYWAIIVDPSWRHCGGWGAHLAPYIAAERAVLEAVQSRAVVIAGARDDLERRDPDWMASVVFVRTLAALPITHQVPNYSFVASAEQEYDMVLERLSPDWFGQIYYKHIDLAPLHVVKVQILGLEQPVLEQWKQLRWNKLIEKLAEQSSMSVQASMESVLNAFGGNNGVDRHEPVISIPKLVLHPARKRSS